MDFLNSYALHWILSVWFLSVQFLTIIITYHYIQIIMTTSHANCFFSELCWGKAMVAYAKPRQMKEEESEMLRGERDRIKFTDLGFERWQVLKFRKARGKQDQS